MILNVSNLSKTYGDRLLFEGANLSVEKGDIVGLIGANGVGKTTLFRLITGTEQPDTGMVVRSPMLKLGYLEQHVCQDSDKTTYEETLSIFQPLKEMEQRLTELRQALASRAEEHLIEEQETLLREYEAKGGLTYQSMTRSVLTGLGFSEEEQGLPVRSLSGGQKSKIGLAKLLLQKPDLMLLDEPTNHLDIASVDWLEKFIAGSNITTIVISHDRYFLDKVCNKIAEITTHKVYVTDGNYTRHMALKAERDLTEERHYKNVMDEVHRLEGVIEQQRRWNREKNIKTAESKQKQIDRLTKNLERPEQERFDFSFAFSPATVSGDDVLELNEVSMAFPDKVLYEHVSFDLKRGERVVIIGDNGIGKTTLIKQIMRRGRGVKYGVGVTVGYFDQHQMNLSLHKSAFDEIHDAYPKMTNTDVRSALAVFGFKQDKVFEEISTLSGGERAKVSLCKLMLQKCNFLLLDEPTNHLDIYACAALEEALKDYDGTLLMISHDRYFMNRLADKIIHLDQEGARVYKGNYDDYVKEVERRGTGGAEEKAPEEKRVGAGGQNYLEQKKLRSERTKAKTALKRAEEKIEKLEQRQEELTAALDAEDIASDFEAISKLSEELADCNMQLEAAMEEWETLAETVNAYEE